MPSKNVGSRAAAKHGLQASRTPPRESTQVRGRKNEHDGSRQVLGAEPVVAQHQDGHEDPDPPNWSAAELMKKATSAKPSPNRVKRKRDGEQRHRAPRRSRAEDVRSSARSPNSTGFNGLIIGYGRDCRPHLSRNEMEKTEWPRERLPKQDGRR